MTPVTEGRLIGGKYQVVGSIGHGGMSDVWLGRDVRLDKLWAIKEIKPNVAGPQGEANRQAILDEASFMKRLDHPAIPRIVDILEEGQDIFVVMDYVDGRSLGELMSERRAPFAQEEVVEWGIQLCDVLGYLHALEPPVVYRDLKPSNVMLRADGLVKLIDFGIADELVGGRGDGRIIGSPGYSAPEQVEADMHAQFPTDERADVYALGTTLYSLVTGEVPRPSQREDGAVGLALDLRPIREVNPELSDGLEAILARATRRRPDERYQCIWEMRFDLEHYEELTREYQEAQRLKVRRFSRRLRLAAAAAAVGVACLGASSFVRGRSYESLLHEASLAGTEEEHVEAGDPAWGVARSAEPSEAERLCLDAMDVDPIRIEAYQRLVDVYRSDQVFTTTESQRWIRLWQRRGQGLAADARLARLCYDVGVLYLCYYDYLGSGGSAGPTVGQGAIECSMRAAEWFSRAHDACDPVAGDYRGLVVSDALDEYAAAEVYVEIGAFHERFSQFSREGRDLTEAYRDLWESLGRVVRGAGGAAPVASRAEPIVQLRLYQVAFEVVASPTYLAGLMRAGVSQGEAEMLLSTVKARVDGLADFASSNAPAAGAMYEEVEAGYGGAAANIDRTYGGPVAALSAPGGEEEG